MIEDLRSIINNRHNVWIIMLIVIVERIKENSKSCPHIRTAENGAVVSAFRSCVPECQAIRSYSSSATYAEYYVYFPPVKICWLFRPYCTWKMCSGS